MAYLTISTWRHLGLGVGLSYIALGTYYSLEPGRAAELFGLAPKHRTRVAEKPPPTEVLKAIEAAEGAHEEANRHWMYLIGARDISMGLAICQFYLLKDAKAMSVVILSGMVICAVDVFEIWMLKGSREGLTLATGAAIWGVVGLNLME